MAKWYHPCVDCYHFLVDHDPDVAILWLDCVEAIRHTPFLVFSLEGIDRHKYVPQQEDEFRELERLGFITTLELPNYTWVIRFNHINHRGLVCSKHHKK